jgi:bifunctional non-homologous end joining protein LigD
MLASPGGAPLEDAHLAYELKYDGIRALVCLDPRATPGRVALYSRLGNEKSSQFPELVRECDRVARGLTGPLVLDGEVVALDAAGHPTSFTALQDRLQVRGRARAAATAERQPAAFVAFDILRDGDEDLRALPLSSRRLRLERVWSDTGSPLLRLSEFAAGDGTALMARAIADGWEGLVAKHLDSRYQSGTRTTDWRKIKLAHRDTFVIAGWTKQRGSRTAVGALVLGVSDSNGLRFAGSVGSGFSHAELQRLGAALAPLRTAACPFADAPPLAEPVTWVRPELMAEVRFAEWTPAGHLRHPVYLGLRDDVVPRGGRLQPAPAGARPAKAGRHTVPDAIAAQLDAVVAQLDELERGPGGGTIVLPDGSHLEVTNLRKVFWPASRHTKGDLLRYYTRVSPFILPVVADRPLVMKRLPNGIAGKSFYQQRGPEHAPEGVRIETVDGDTDVPNRAVGGTLRTLLYLTQLAVISQDPWFSRVQSPDSPDFVAFDLDPMPGVSFSQVRDVARHVRDELDTLGIAAAPKTSGSTGLHLFVKLPAGLPFQAGQLFAQIVATLVSQKCPSLATVERAVESRGRTVYVDYLQNIRGKSLACAYSARASEFAGVSMPLTWADIDTDVDPRDFTLDNAWTHLAQAGDRWAAALKGKPADLEAVFRYASGRT